MFQSHRASSPALLFTAALLLINPSSALAIDERVETLHDFAAYVNARSLRGPLFYGSDGRLYGTSHLGGAYDDGTLFSIRTDGSDYRTLVHFNHADVKGDGGFGLIEGSDGRLYGVSVANRRGIYSVNRDGSNVRRYDVFNDQGLTPIGGLTEGSDGRLYGYAQELAAPFGEVIYTLDRSGNAFQVLHRLPRGTALMGRLVVGRNGRLYGISGGGGSHGSGTLFTAGVNGTEFTILHEFGANNERPLQGLLPASDGALYGLFQATGNTRESGLYRFDASGFQPVHHFAFDANETHFSAGLIEGRRDGRLYGGVGFSPQQPDLIFSVRRDGSDFRILAHVGADERAIEAPPSLVQDGAGQLYGVEDDNFPLDDGLIYSLNPNNGAVQTVHQFFRESHLGYWPNSPVRGPDDRLYGTVSSGRVGFYSVGPRGENLKIVYEVDPSVEGSEPFPTLLAGGGGKFFGGMNFGGPHGGGTLYSFDPARRRFQVLHEFMDHQYAQPDMPLIRARDGRLYGYNHWDAEIFSIQPTGSQYRVLLRTPGDAAGLFEVAPERFILVSGDGGVHHDGAIYRFGRGGSRYQLLHSLGGLVPGTAEPRTAMHASDGIIYCTTSQGVFSYDPAADRLHVLRVFDDSWGSPANRLYEASDGRLYGATGYGGAHGTGIIYSIDKTGNSFAVHYNYPPEEPLRPAEYQVPAGAFTEAADGRLVGAGAGGRFGRGVLYAMERPLRIVTQPQNLQLTLGDTGELVAGASGRGPIEFQWYQNGSRIRGATQPVLGLTSVNADHAGEYRVRIRARGQTLWSDYAVVGIRE